jgi:hypothetical protein
MADSLPSQTVEALLSAIKKHAQAWEQEPNSVAAAESLNHLAEAYAWLQRPVRGTGR